MTTVVSHVRFVSLALQMRSISQHLNVHVIKHSLIEIILFGNRKLPWHLPSIQCWGKRCLMRFRFLFDCRFWGQCPLSEHVPHLPLSIKWFHVKQDSSFLKQFSQVTTNSNSKKLSSIAISGLKSIHATEVKTQIYLQSSNIHSMLLCSHAKPHIGPQSHFIQSKTPASL